MRELAALKIMFSQGRSIKCGIVKMHYRYWRICSAPALQDLRKRPEHLFLEVAAIDLFPEWNPIDEDGAVNT
jgi:hypothetical protein